jgi:hypothetical protein
MREQNACLLEQLAQRGNVLCDGVGDRHIRHPCGNRLRAVGDRGDIIDVIDGVDASARKDVRATHERDAVAPANQKHVDRRSRSQQDDRRRGARCGDAHRFCLYPDGALPARKARTSGTKNDKGQADPWPLAISEIE